MFDGDMSRCTMPSGRPVDAFFSCAKCSPAAAPMTIVIACWSGSRLPSWASLRVIQRRSSPCRYSMVKKYVPPVSPMS